MKDLKEIGFYTLSDARCQHSSLTSQMKRGEIIINEYCNFKCNYCRPLSSIIFAGRRVKHMIFDEVKHVIDLWCEDEPIENIRFSGGEPTLHPDIHRTVAYANFKGIERIAISTNGSNDYSKYEQLWREGVNDFSISLDACCAEVGDNMAGGVKGAWDIVVNNIRAISKICYVTVGIVLTPENVGQVVDTIHFAHSLGVADIRVIPAAQWNKPILELEKVRAEVLAAHPILRFRVNQFINGVNVRGLHEDSAKHCGLVLDDSAIAGNYQYPCIIYMREHGQPISTIGPGMRQKRYEWFLEHDCTKDPICSSQCLEVCRFYNDKFRDINVLYTKVKSNSV